MSKEAPMHTRGRPEFAPGRPASWKTIVFTAIVSASFALLVDRHSGLRPVNGPPSTISQLAVPPTRRCRPPLPNIFTQQPIHTGESQIQHALLKIDDIVRNAFSGNDIDGMAVAIVTPEAVIYEAGLGALKANETDPWKRGVVDRHSIFRIASGSKLFAVLETLILRESGALQWDDPITKFFPNFTYSAGGWPDMHVAYSSSVKTSLAPAAPITLRQLATHMSGLGREYPRGDMMNWPHSMEGMGPPPLNGCPFPTVQETVEGLAKYPLVVPTYSYPVYSNAGMAVLGQAAVVANRNRERNLNGVTDIDADSPGTWPALAKRDIFDRLGLNGSSFVVTPANAAHVAVAAENSDEVDLDFLDAMSASGGQMSSLSDYIKIMQMILDPSRPGSLLPPHVIREWLRPLHVWSDETTEVGMLWEINKIADTHGRQLRIYQKSGSLDASRSVFAVNPEMNYGVAMLTTGPSGIASKVALDIFGELQPSLDQILTKNAVENYAGTWESADQADSESRVVLTVQDGSLWISELKLNGTDVLRMTQGFSGDGSASEPGMPVMMWSTGRHDEFRVVFGDVNSCIEQWTAIDSGFARGYPIDLIYFTESQDIVEGYNGGQPLIMHIPSVGIQLLKTRPLA